MKRQRLLVKAFGFSRVKVFCVVLGLALIGGCLFYVRRSSAQGGAGLTGSIGSSGVWRDVDVKRLGAVLGGARTIFPRRFRTVSLDALALKTLLLKAPMEFTAAARSGGRIEVSLPKPDGTLARFLVEESPVMEPTLAAKFPLIKTYRAQGVDDRAATARFGISPYGFHAIVLSPSGAYYIDPYRRNDAVTHISYFKSDYPRRAEHEFACDLHSPDGKSGDSVISSNAASNEGAASGPGSASAAAVATSMRPNAGTLRAYRLALAATYEYSSFHSPQTIPDKGEVMARGLVPAVNRVSGIYEREIGVHLNLVANNDLIIFNTPAQPYVNDNGTSMLATNQATLDAVIGTLNYDIGHVASTGGGGVAFLGVVCTVQKAGGVTGLPQPTGDPYYVDYVAHEMGHQFGGNHTFNGSSGACAGSQRSETTAYEVGSGSTIQAYAGICSPQNLQPNSDPYFHGVSYDEILTHITTEATCAVMTETGNNAPLIEAGPDYNIPALTPFTLTAQGSDADGDTLSYAWEEFDLGPTGDGRADNGSSPILRSFNPTTNPSRTFPKLADLINDTTTYGEILPATTRTMNFRVTARDNRAGAGGVDYDSMKVNVTATAGPFVITAPNGNEWWTSGSTKTITWNVANTDQAPISATQVDIQLSTDGGQTFPIVLATAVPNDGAQDITVPGVATADARVRVVATGNIFFDISNADFYIDPPPQAPVANNDLATVAFQTPTLIPVMANDTDVDGPVLAVVAAQSATNAGGSASVNDNGTPSNTADDGVWYTPPPGFAGVDQFSYTISDGGLTSSAMVTVTVPPFCAPEPTGNFVADFEADNNGFTVLTPINAPASPAWGRMVDPQAHSGTSSFFTDAVLTQGAVKDDRLISPPQLISSSSKLIFWHRFDFELDWDGGLLEVSTNGGASYVDITAAGGTFVSGGYTKVMGNGPLALRQAWTGRSPGFVGNPTMIKVEVDLAALAGRTAIFRWRLRTDDLTGDEAVGWWVDDVQFTNLLVAPPCNTPPWAQGQAVTTNEDVPLNITLGATDDGQTPVTFTVESGPGHGTLGGSAPNLTYTPAGNFNGSDSFTFRANDGAHGSNLATVAITVVSVNDAPAAALAATPSSGTAPLTVNLDASSSSDPEGDAITSYRFNFGDGSPEVTQAAATISHVYNSPGNYSATVVVTDAHGALSTNNASAGIQVSAAPAVESIEDDDARIAYSSAWHLVNDSRASAGHFRYHTGKAATHSAKLDFNVPSGRRGTITYYFARSTGGGTADVYLDGIKKATVNYKGANGSTKAPAFEAGLSLSYADLAAGAHSLEIKNLDGVVYLDRFVLESAGSIATPAAAPGATTNEPSSAGGGGTSSTSYAVPANAQSLSIVTESSVKLPFQLLLVSPSGVTLQTVSASNGMATVIQPVTAGGVYVVKVVNLNVGALQMNTTITPLVKK